MHSILFQLGDYAVLFWMVMFMFSKKATKNLKKIQRRFNINLLSVKWIVKILQFFVAVLENMNFIIVKFSASTTEPNTFWSCSEPSSYFCQLHWVFEQCNFWD